MTTVRELIELYEGDEIDYPQLLEALTTQDFAPHTPAHQLNDWGEIYERAEDMPDDNSFFWIESAECNGALTEEQVEEIAAAIQQHHQT